MLLSMLINTVIERSLLRDGDSDIPAKIDQGNHGYAWAHYYNNN